MKTCIYEAIISSRNMLFGGHANQNFIASLEQAIAQIEFVTVKFSRNIIRACLAEAARQVSSNKLMSAGMILNLIHNLPLVESAADQWDIDYFLSVELAEFLDKFDEIESSRSIALLVFSQINSDSFPVKTL